MKQLKFQNWDESGEAAKLIFLSLQNMKNKFAREPPKLILLNLQNIKK